MTEGVPVAEAAKDAEKESSWASETKELVKALAWALAFAFVLRSFVVEAYKIPSGSMLPTLEVGDHIFVNKFIYGFMIPFTTVKIGKWRQPTRGEVIVFKYPNNPSQDYIKRVIGVPGDVVETRGRDLYVNDVKMEDVPVGPSQVVDQGCYPTPVERFEERLDTGITHAKIHFQGRPPALSPGTWTVPEGSLFMMGDNRDNSQDSRTGFVVPYNYVKGRAMFVWLSWNGCESWWPFHKLRLNRFGQGVQ